MKEVQACIFDLDGVLCDTAKYHYLAWKRLAEVLGFEFTLEQNERLKGVSRMESLEILLKAGGIQADETQKAIWAEQKNNWYVAYIKQMDKSEILPGTCEFLEGLREAGIGIALGSSSKNAPLILDRLGIRDYFDVIVDGSRITNAKPDPGVFLLGARELQVLPENCVVFEDAEAGIRAAVRAGMRSVGIGDPELLKDADLVIPNLAGMNWEML